MQKAGVVGPMLGKGVSTVNKPDPVPGLTELIFSIVSEVGAMNHDFGGPS